MTRRQMLAGGAAAVAVATAAGFAPKVFAQACPHRIDVHHHVVAADLARRGHGVIGRKTIRRWRTGRCRRCSRTWTRAASPPRSLSPTTPQVIGLDKDGGRRVARESNEYAKKLEADHPGRFGTFAMLPFPHIDESLKEIAYAFDTLKVDGIGCMTSYGDKWLGLSPSSSRSGRSSTAARPRSIRIRPPPIAASISCSGIDDA